MAAIRKMRILHSDIISKKCAKGFYATYLKFGNIANALTIVMLAFLLSGCIIPRIGYFETDPNIEVVGPKLDQNLNISLRMAVADSFNIESPDVPKIRLLEFRKTMATALRNTFKNTYQSISWINGFSAEGLSIVIARVEPKWYRKAETSQGIEVASEISYQAILYLNGEQLRTLQGNAHSQLSSQFTTGALNVLRDGIRVMCIQLYKEVMTEASNTGTFNGTGFLVSNNGYILTNSHVIESARSIKVKGVGGDFSKEYPATIVTDDKANDLALLKVKEAKFDSVPYTIRSKGLETGEDVFVLGYPKVSVMGEEIKLTKGLVSSKSGFQGNNSTYQISAQVQPGNSGSPVFDDKGNLIGVVTSKIMEAEGVGYAIKPSFIRSIFENAELELRMKNTNTMETVSLAEKTRIIAPFVYIIKVER